MRAQEFENPKNTFVEIFRKFLPLAMKIIGLNSLPKMVFEKEVESPEQPTFGQYINNKHILHVGLANRHPNDILRTIAHELVHYKQDTENKLNDMSGATGSPQENEAHAIAGVVMRNFNKRYPEYLKTKPIISESQLRSNDIENVKFDNDKLDDLKSKYLPDWEMLDHKVLQAKYVAKDHRHAEEFIEFINKISEKMDHFAEVTQDVAEVSVKTTTFDVKGLTILDFKLALMVDKFAQKNDIEQVRMSGNFGMYEGTLKKSKSAPLYHLGKNLINEAQTFDFDGEKQAIIQFINNVLNNKPNNRQYNPFYGVIVGNPKIGGASKLGLPDTFAASWKKYFQNPSFVGGSPEPWSQINIGDQFEKATGDDRTLNFYITVDKEKNNIIKFFNNLHKLGSYLQPISQQYQTPLKFKTHSLLDSFIGHNDSLKVYYYDPQVKDLVVNATRKWLSDSGIVTGTRSHEHGVDVKSGGGSFGQILSNHVYDTFTKLIQTNKTKYTPEQYFEWLKQHLPSLIQQVKQKEVAENFADGRNPQDKGDSARHGIRKGMTLAQLKKVRSSDSASPRKKQLAHWQINMRQGQKKNESAIDNKAEGYLSKVNKLGSFLGSFVDIPSWDKSGSSKVVRTVDDRVSVLIKIGGINIPFYCSTGEGGKVTVPTGKWYPFFGFGPGGWMNKGSEKSINAFYGSGIFKTYANVLNLRLGDLRNDETVPYIKKTGRDVFNQDMLNPQDNVKTTDDANLFKKRINSILAKTGSDPFYVIENKKP